MKEVKNFLIQLANNPLPAGDFAVDMSPSPRFDDQTSPQADPRCARCPSVSWQYFTGKPIGNLDNPSDLLDPPLIFWDRVTKRNCVVMDCFSSQMFEETTYWQLEAEDGSRFWRRDWQVEDAHA
jgi:hypothetical protein